MTDSATGAKAYFLSYSRADGEFALRFANDLIAAGVSLWVDQYDIRASEHWDNAIERAVRCCEGLIVILSPRSVGSANVADEVAVAIEAGKRVIPILIERCAVPLRMTRMQLIDATTGYDGARRKCLEELNRSLVATRSAVDSTPREQPQPAAADSSGMPLDIARIPPEVLRRIGQELARFLGPIAPQLAKGEATSAKSIEQLSHNLSLHIPSEAERASFLRAIRAE